MFRLPVHLSRIVVMCLLALSGLLLASCALPFSEETQYASTVFNHARRTLSSLNTLNELATDPRLNDPAWISEVNRELGHLRGLIDEANEIDPPPNLAEVHQSYLDAVNSLEPVAATYDQAVEFRNHAMLDQAQQRLEQGRATLEQVRQRLDDMPIQ